MKLLSKLLGPRIGAVVWLTWKAALRFRVFLVVNVLLLASVVGLPLLIKDDGTARGFTQILLTYTLSTITGLLGLSTLWLACGTLARDIEEQQMQVVAVKPIARWQIWLGKWLGIVTLDAALLAISGACVYGLLQYRSTRLPAAEQEILHNEVLVSRGSFKERNFDKEIEEQTDKALAERVKGLKLSEAELQQDRAQIHDQVVAEIQSVPPGSMRPWFINVGLMKTLLRDQPLTVRVKFNAADKSPSGTFMGMFRVGGAQGTNFWESEPMSLAPDTFHEFTIPPNLYDEHGMLAIVFFNHPANNTTLLFPLDDGLEVLFPEGGFAANFARGLAIILFWMALLAAVGLASASFLSFPVAAFLSLTVLVVAMSTSTLSSVVEDNRVMGYSNETGKSVAPVADAVLVPMFYGALQTVKMAEDFSPIDSLSSGRSIEWTTLLKAFGQIVLVLGGPVIVFGMIVFSRRELATAQGTT